MSKIKVMIVDDSAVVRMVLSERLAREPSIEVLDTASDPLFAMKKMEKHWPDVVVLDVEMPRMDGITFLKKLMAERPTPVVICSTLTEKGAEITLQALAAGAVSVVAKPKSGLKEYLLDGSNDLVHAVRAAAAANLRQLGRAGVSATQPETAATVERTVSQVRLTETIVAIGASTGGTQALERVLHQLPALSPGIVVVQHMPETFTAAFAERLNRVCRIEVREARSGDRVVPGRALIAPGGHHMVLRRSGAQYHVDIVDAPPVNRHRPSVDVLFRSTAREAGRNALGIIMTGMGADGAQGLKAMRDGGARTLAQDEASCVVFGMPKEAIRLGGVDEILPLDGIPREIMAVSHHGGALS